MTAAQFASLDTLIHRFRELGATQLAVKCLSENDNSKQQVYLGQSFESLNLLPFNAVRSDASRKVPNFKATLDLRWIDAHGHEAQAPGAQLILYPQYPEVRLSGFLIGCPIAPSAQMQPISREKRRFNNGPDGRVLVLGIGAARVIYAYLAPATSPIAREFEGRRLKNEFKQVGVFWTQPLAIKAAIGRAELLKRLAEIHDDGWHGSRRLTATGAEIPYTARNGAGLTLEALLGIRPNSRSAPDFLGWEVKSFSSSRITLMTPEPDEGLYGKDGVAKFVRKFGRYSAEKDRYYFTGTHKINIRQETSGQLMRLRGFDAAKHKIVDVEGGIELRDRGGALSAGWSFARLIEHWGRKHAAAVYVPCLCRGEPPEYRYASPVFLGQGTDFSRFLLTLAEGLIIYDPGCKVEKAQTSKPVSKARNQFRIAHANLSRLYVTFEEFAL